MEKFDGLLNIAFLSFVDRIDIFSFLYDKKDVEFFYNNLGIQGVVTYFYGRSKRVSIFSDV